MNQPHHRPRGLLIAALLALLLVGAWLLLRHRSAPAPAAAVPRVGVAVAALRDVPQTLSVIGTVQSTVSATVRPQLAGTIFAIDAREGQMVRKGQRLALIDPRPYQLAIAQAEGTMARDAAQLDVAQADLARYQRLLAQQSIARQQVETQAGTVKQLQGTLDADRAALGTARLNLRYTRIVAPIAGRIGLRHTDLGNYVTPSDTAGVFTITVDDPIDVSFAVPQDRIGDVRGAPDGRVQVDALRQSDGARLASGRLLAVDNQADGSTGTVTAKARFGNARQTLFANQFVDVSIRYGLLSHAVVVPVSAVRHGAQGDFLFAVGTDHIVHTRQIRLGPSLDAQVVIMSGIRAGETVVSNGADALDDGMRIDPLPDARQPRP